MDKTTEAMINLINDHKALWSSPKVHGVLCGEGDSVIVSRKMFDRCVSELSGDYISPPKKKTFIDGLLWFLGLGLNENTKKF